MFLMPELIYYRFFFFKKPLRETEGLGFISCSIGPWAIHYFGVPLSLGNKCILPSKLILRAGLTPPKKRLS